MCCAIGALLIAAIATWRSGLKAAFNSRPQARWAAASAAAAMVMIAGSALAAKHFDHYVARAQANELSLPAEIPAQPICDAGALGDRADTDVSLSETVRPLK